MEEAISPAVASRDFLWILRNVKAGRTYVVTSCGIPVARIVPARRNSAVSQAAKQILIARLRSRPVEFIGPRWSRDELSAD
jgi:antitoxin (DNA-binding transcriptional repressor) of toxin-antitoxin stability system